MFLLLPCYQNNQETQKGHIVFFIQNSWRVGKFNCIFSRIGADGDGISFSISCGLSLALPGSPQLSMALPGTEGKNRIRATHICKRPWPPVRV